MRFLKKSFTIFTLFFVLRTFSGCFNYDCPDDIYTFDFTKIQINNIDNSGKWPKILATDTMNKAAVAFQVYISSDLPYIAVTSRKIKDFGFANTSAFSKTECPIYYQSIQAVKSISISTLTSLSEEIPPHTEISDLFFGSNETGWYETNLYLPFEELCKSINHTYEDKQAVQFRIFLNREVENDSAQFIVNVNFTDNKILSDTTKLIFIR